MNDIKFLDNDNEIIRIDAEGFHYQGQFIEDAGEAHRLLVEFLRKHQPEGLWKHASYADETLQPSADTELIIRRTLEALDD